jgi:hypothetical protein
VTKTVANITTGTGFQGSPTVVAASSGDQVQFRIRIANVGTTALTNLVLYDVLPHPGDTGVIADQATVPRGSTRQPVLSAVTVPSGWSATYTANTNPCRAEVGAVPGCTATTWQGTRPATTGAIRLTASTLAATSFVDVLLTYTVPAAGLWTLGDVAWNSVGAVATQGNLVLPATEAPKVGFGYPSARLTWRKTDAGDGLLGGAAFRVTGPGGYDQVVTDNQPPDADPADGVFLLATGISVGTYTITEVTAPDGYLLDGTPVQVVVTATGQEVDAGKVVNRRVAEFMVRKVGENAGGTWAPIPGSRWGLFDDDAGQVGDPAAGVMVTPVDPDGEGLASQFKVAGVAPGTYWLVEVQAPSGFSLLAQPLQVSVSGAGVVSFGDYDAAIVSVEPATSQSVAQVTVRDVPALVFPVAGGVGDTWVATIGTMLAGMGLLAGVLWWHARRRRTRDTVLVAGGSGMS